MEVSLDILVILFLSQVLQVLLIPWRVWWLVNTSGAFLAAEVPPTNALATNKLQSSFGSFLPACILSESGIVNLKEMRLAICVLSLVHQQGAGYTDI